MAKGISALCTCFVMLASQGFAAQEGMQYRGFRLGSDLASVAKLAGAAPADAKLIHERPAVIKELEWRPRYFPKGVTSQPDPVDVMTFGFYDDQLFKVIVDYDRDRTAGLSEADVIDAITATYGPATKLLPKVSRTAGLQYGTPDTPIAIWGDAEYSVTLLRVAYPETFRLVVALTRLENLARVASLEAVRLDSKEAPQREIDRQKKEADEALAAQKKANSENKAVFRP